MQSNNDLQQVASHALLIILCMLMGGMFAICLGKDLGWDMANYHYYNAYAFLHARWLIDYWPASNLHVHLTPTLDLFAYYLINHFTPFITVFIIGAIHGLNIWLLYLLARAVLISIYFPLPDLNAFMVALIGIYAPLAFPGIGSFQHDDFVSIFILAYIYLHWQFAQALTTRFAWRGLISANLLLGLALGAKLTVACFALAGCISYIFLPMKAQTKIKCICIAVICLTIGMLITDGYWMLFLWQKYHNPIYPFFNAIFQSSSSLQVNWRDTRFLPKTWLQTIFYPFYFSTDGRTADNPFRDFRFVLVYVVGLVFVIRSIILRRKSLSHGGLISIANTWLLVYFLLAYIIWQTYFSIMRYAVTLEMLAPLIIILLLALLINSEPVRFILVFALAAFIINTSSFTFISRSNDYHGNYFNVQLPTKVQTISHALVLMPYPAYAQSLNPWPQNYLIAFFPSTWRFVGIPFLHNQYLAPQEIATMLASDPSKHLFMLTDRGYLAKMQAVLKSYHLYSADTCEEIKSDRQAITQRRVLLCALKRESAADYPSHI